MYSKSIFLKKYIRGFCYQFKKKKYINIEYLYQVIFKKKIQNILCKFLNLDKIKF